MGNLQIQQRDARRRYHFPHLPCLETAVTLPLRFALLTIAAALSAPAVAAGPAKAVQSAASAASGIAARTESAVKRGATAANATIERGASAAGSAVTKAAKKVGLPTGPSSAPAPTHQR